MTVKLGDGVKVLSESEMIERKWSNRSQAVFLGLDPELQKLLNFCLEHVADITLLEGHRRLEEQNAAFESGNSHVKWPDSKHNLFPSLAVDLAPYPKPSEDTRLWAALGYIAGRIIQEGVRLGITVRWGGLWAQDGNFVRRQFNDGWHLEILPKVKETEK